METELENVHTREDMFLPAQITQTKKHVSINVCNINYAEHLETKDTFRLHFNNKEQLEITANKLLQVALAAI